ncbi:hypothetical protein [Gluconobacter kanchanaburiensis]|uniref:Uncharacterized protein n=1 Tax=Gluconobacter kanchanaburiensis NBRC 103587 TaxID=1307948 RepID=A0A511B8C7_9PROT|nr:hypothetical protein [Gluconobacter kanchanaburiensis]MBF0861255.1 hypothetical protein [Gluconobacter kanchanaburiensis]GBR70951.1 hypothetical protein AA103587_2141 [Gluconobacter kanchanaburiensis NBRC 103587]GEK95922.1 hypothetical protein GKA01_11190 [Gluconobacter kanchanaburiensis NBRC 103587]
MVKAFDWAPHFAEIEQMLRSGKTRREIANHLGVKETSLSSMIARHSLAGLSPNGSAKGGSSPENTHNRIDWEPLLPVLLEMMERAESATVIAKKRGISWGSLSAAIERQVPKALRTKWKKARHEVTHPKRVQAAPETRQPYDAYSDVTWSALWNGNPPPVPDFAFGRDGRLH